MTTTFEKLKNADISNLTKEKGKFEYLSWSNAVREATKICPDMSWEFTKFGEHGLPYLQTPLGFFVECAVTIEGVTKTQLMPVLNHMNKTEQNPDAALINKTNQRALTKAIALHGLGLDLWAGEDINDYDEFGNNVIEECINEEQQGALYNLLCDSSGNYTPFGLKACQAFKFNNLNEIKSKQFEKIFAMAQKGAK